MNTLAYLLSSTFFLGLPLSIAHADTLTIPASQDNTLFESASGSLSNGSGLRGFFGTTAQGNKRRYLIQFDIAGSLPAGSTIQSVSFEFSPLGIAPANPGNLFQDVHRLDQAWGEGASNAGTPGGQGTGAAAGDATWIHTFSPSGTWTNAGGDFNASASGFSNYNNYGRWMISGAGMTSDVQNWLDNPTSNFGWMLKGRTEANSTAVAISSREDTAFNTQPLLIIDFTPPGLVFSPFCGNQNNNSTGVPTMIAGSQTLVGVNSGLHLEATQGPPNQFGYFVVGNAVALSPLPVGSGLLCIEVVSGGAIWGRYNFDGTPLNSLGIFDGAGVFQNLVGTSNVSTGFDVPIALPFAISNPMIMAGDTWNFQLWHRENNGDSNLSTGMSVTF